MRPLSTLWLSLSIYILIKAENASSSEIESLRNSNEIQKGASIFRAEPLEDKDMRKLVKEIHSQSGFDPRTQFPPNLSSQITGFCVIFEDGNDGYALSYERVLVCVKSSEIGGNDGEDQQQQKPAAVELEKEGDKFHQLEKEGDKFHQLEKEGDKFDQLEKEGDKFQQLEKEGDKFHQLEKEGDKFHQLEKEGDKFDQLEKEGDKFHQLEK